jgi:opacity protein-like surface antigen
VCSRKLVGVLAFAAFIHGTSAAAADKPFDWSGFYFGAHAGGARGTTTFSNPDGPSVYGDDVSTTAFLAGLQVGYNWLLAPTWLAGLQVDGSVLSGQGQNTCFQSSSTIVGANCRVFPGEVATLTGRLGYITEPGGRTMIFGKAGVAWMRTDLAAVPNNASFNGFPAGTVLSEPTTGPAVNRSSSTWGWTVGVGLEHALAPKWSASVGYDYLRFNGSTITTPDTTDVTSGGVVTPVPGGMTSSVSQSMHVVRVGLNYHFGGKGASAVDAAGGATEPAWRPAWEVEGGLRYWYSWGNFQTSNGPGTGSLVSRLPYDNMEGHSGEIFARLDSPFNVFVKGLFGGGGISHGTAYDEDWGLDSISEPTGYEITRSGINGSFNYFTIDLGYNLLRGADHKVGLFVGYNRYQVVMNMVGCEQMVAPGSGVCFPAFAPGTNGISEMDTWHSFRVGTSVELQLMNRLKVSADLAYLPYTRVYGLDIHRARQPPVNFPVTGTGEGVQAEIMLSYRIFDSFSVGLGGRYWALWTNDAYQTDAPTNKLTYSTDRYGVMVQASYKFN